MVEDHCEDLLPEDGSLLNDGEFSFLDGVIQNNDMMKKVEAGWRVISSGILIPDSLKGHPYTRPILIGALVIFFILPIKLYLLLVTVGLILGILLNPNWEQQGSSATSALRAQYGQLEGRNIPTEEPRVSTGIAKLSLTPKIDAALDTLLDRLVCSLIDPWYMNQNKSGQRDFQSCVRTTLDVALASLRGIVRDLGKDSMTLFLYGLTNALNVHMQEFKAFCREDVSSSEFLSSPKALRTFCPTMQAEVGHFRQIVSVLLRKLLPRQESQSIVLVALLKEVIGSGALWNAMDRICDPDFINMKIVEAMRGPVPDLAAKLTPGWSLVILKGNI